MAVQKQQEVGKKLQTTSQPVASAISPEDSELEQYGVWVKEGPEDIIGVDEESALTPEEEELLGTLEDATGEEPRSAPEATDEGLELENLDEDFSFDLEEEHLELDELPDLGEPVEQELRIESPVKTAGPSSRPTTSTTSRQAADLEPIDDVSAFEADLSDSSEEGESMRIPEGSHPILQKIEEDLLSIKKELAALKTEIYSLRGTASPSRPEEKPKEEEVGFFAEDEDETIALTGDELDNILNTADITEETGEPTAIPEDNELIIEEAAPEPDRLIDKDNILELEEEAPALMTAAPVATEEEVPIELPEEEIVLEDLSGPEAEEPEPISEEEINAFDEIQIDLPESEEEAGIEELPEITLDEEELPTEEIELGEEFDLSTSEKEALESETGELADTDFLEPLEPAKPAPAATVTAPRIAVATATTTGAEEIPDDLKTEIKSILKYMDQLLEALPEDKIEEFARSEYFEVYKKLFDELGLTT